MKHLKVIAIMTIVALGAMGAAYAFWNQKAEVNTSISTYDWAVVVCDDVGNCHTYTEDANFEKLTIAYSDETKAYTIKNNSNVPIAFRNLYFEKDDTALEDFSYSVMIDDYQVIKGDQTQPEVTSDSMPSQLIIDSKMTRKLTVLRQPTNREYVAPLQAEIASLTGQLDAIENGKVKTVSSEAQLATPQANPFNQSAGTPAQSQTATGAALQVSNTANNQVAAVNAEQPIVESEAKANPIKNHLAEGDTDSLKQQLAEKQAQLSKRQSILDSGETARSLIFEIEIAPEQ